MKENLQNHLHVAIVLVSLVLAIVVGAWYVEHNQRQFENALRAELDRERATLITLAEITDRNGADAVIEQTVSDCTRRTEYESLLVRLATLSPKELIILQGLFEGCGSFYAERKALMVAKLEREYEVYTNFANLLSTFTTRDITDYRVQKWGELITLENERSTLLTDQKNIQANIISALINGNSVQGTLVSGLVHDAQEINQLLVVHDRRIDDIREIDLK